MARSTWSELAFQTCYFQLFLEATVFQVLR